MPTPAAVFSDAGPASFSAFDLLRKRSLQLEEFGVVDPGGTSVVFPASGRATLSFTGGSSAPFVGLLSISSPQFNPERGQRLPDGARIHQNGPFKDVKCVSPAQLGKAGSRPDVVAPSWASERDEGFISRWSGFAAVWISRSRLWPTRASA